MLRPPLYIVLVLLCTSVGAVCIPGTRTQGNWQKPGSHTKAFTSTDIRQAHEVFNIKFDEPILSFLVESSTKRVIVATESSIRLIDTIARQTERTACGSPIRPSTVEWSLKLLSPPISNSIIPDSCGSRFYWIDRNDTVHAVGAFGGARLWSRAFPNSINTGTNGLLYHSHDFDAKLTVMLDREIVTLSAVTGETSAEYFLEEEDDWFFGRIHQTQQGLLVASMRVTNDPRMPEIVWESQRVHHINIETGHPIWISSIGRIGLVAEEIAVSGSKRISYLVSGVNTAALSLLDGSILWTQKEKGKLLEFAFHQDRADYLFEGAAATSTGVAVMYSEEKNLYLKMINETGYVVWTKKAHNFDFDGRLDSEVLSDGSDVLITSVTDRDNDVIGVTAFDSVGTIFADYEFPNTETLSPLIVPFGLDQSRGCLAFRSGLKEVKGLCD